MSVRPNKNTSLIFANTPHNDLGRAIGLRHGELRETFNGLFVLGFGIRALLNAGMLYNIGINATRVNGADTNAGAAHFVAQRIGKAQHTIFGGIISALGRHADKPENR